MKQQQTGDFDSEVLSALEKFVYDPLGYVEFMYSWGEGRLVDYPDGPDEWQRRVLTDIGNYTRTATKAERFAVRSGHGIGKGALSSWVIDWFINCKPHPQIVVTANTRPQLETKTWREVAKWWGLKLNKHWFKHTATKYYSVFHPETWFAAAIPWSKDNTEAFAGTHEEYVLVVYDESSKIDDEIWEVTEGAMTTANCMWLCLGNPTRNTGRFSSCFKSDKARWHTYEIDSRTAKMANKAEIAEWGETYGEDSDFFRVRVLGKEPRKGMTQLISEDAALAARGKEYPEHMWGGAAKVIGIDIARYGDDKTAMITRQGCQSYNLKKYRGLDTNAIVSIASRRIHEEQPDAVFIDEGYNPGVLDNLLGLNFDCLIIGVQFGSRPADQRKFVNKRTEMWWEMKDWIEGGAGIPDDKELFTDLTIPEYMFNEGNDKIQLERKKDMKDRGFDSPDCGDALALTFAEPVFPRRSGLAAEPSFSKYDYDVLEHNQAYEGF